MSGTLRIGVLGPLTATVDGAPVPLAGRRLLGVLAALVAGRPEPQKPDRLMADVWHDEPSVAANTVQYQISRLRALLDPHRPPGTSSQTLIHTGAGYRLRLDRDAVDADLFAELARRGRQRLRDGDLHAAVDDLDHALRLVRSRPYDDVADLPFLAPETARLTELVRTVAEERLRGWQLLGRHADVVAEAQALTVEQPLREAGWTLLVTSLAADGRQADALQAIRTIRRILADELGIDPGPELMEVERAVLAQQILPPPRLDRVGPPRLPVPGTDLLGREALVEAVERRTLHRGIVTLTGPGGVGKTRVALEVARRRAQPSVWIELAPYGSGDDLVAVIAEKLDVVGVRDVDDLVGHLTSRPLLLVLDNGEHLVDALAEVLPPLAAVGSAHLLLTSREALDIPGETVVEVPPLTSDAAVELFTARAAAAQPDWRRDEDGARVRQICDGLDRLPLALELAAARLRLLSVADLVDGLGRRFDLLADGHRGAPRHQQGLLQTVAWSVRGASESEQRLLGIVSVFPDSFDLDDAVAVALLITGDDRVAGDHRASVISLLAGLVRQSLVAAVPDTSPRRFRLLLTIRAFAWERLTAAEQERVHRAYLHRVQTITRNASRLVVGPQAGQALARLRALEPDLRAALGIARDLGDGAALLDLVGALGWPWYRAAHLDGIRWARLALALGRDSERSERGPSWFALGRLLYLAGEPGPARQALQEAADAGAAATTPELAAQARVWLAHLITFVDGPDAGVTAAESAVVSASGADTYVQAEALMVLGLALRAAGSGPPARQTLRRAIATGTEAGHTWSVVSSTWALMKAERDAGNTTEAIRLATTMIDPLAADGDVSSTLVLMHTTAAALAQAGLIEETRRLHDLLRRRVDDTGFHPDRMDPLDGPAEAALIRSVLDPSTPGRPRADLDPALLDLLQGLLQQLEAQAGR